MLLAILEFSSFMLDNALVDIPLKGSLYTLVQQSIVILLFSYDHSSEQQ